MGLSNSPIEAKWFINLEGYKTKLNWFLLEVALEYYDRIRDSKELASYRKQYDAKQIAQFCTYYIRRLKPGMLKLLTEERKRVIFYEEYIEDFYPYHTVQLNRSLLKVAKGAFNHMYEACMLCPQQCLREYYAPSPLFDSYKEEGLIT